MSEVRKDNKKRKLRDGESQLADGRYRFRYVGVDGKRHDVYSWRLEATDPHPPGEKNTPPLRVQERQITADLLDGISSDGGNLTVVQLCEKYLATKINVKLNTVANYKTTMNILKSKPFGQLRISKIKEIDAKEFLIHLQQEDGRSSSSVHSIRGVLRPAFALAVKNDYIRKNPFDFSAFTIIVNDGVRRDALTHDQKRKFLAFIKNDKHFCKYYDAIYILFYTGMRISELLNLTLKDLNIKMGFIKVIGKGNKERMIPIGSYVGEILEQYINDYRAEFNIKIERQLIRPSNMRYTI